MRRCRGYSTMYLYVNMESLVSILSQWIFSSKLNRCHDGALLLVVQYQVER